MSFPSRRPIALLVLALGLLVGFAGATEAQPPTDDAAPKPVRKVEPTGLECFRRLLYDLQEEHGFQPIQELRVQDGHVQNARQMALIIVGNPNGLQGLQAPAGNVLERYLLDGGALFVATDQHTPPVLQDTLRFEVTGRLLTIDPNSQHAYLRGSPNAHYCPLVDISPSTRSQVPVFKNLRRIATNHPSYLEGMSMPELLARLPAECQPRVPPSRDFAYGGFWGNQGARVLVLADHSVFINCMMLQEDNDNIALANNCLEWLTVAPDGQRRTQILYVEDGRVRTDFYVPLDEPKLPPLTMESANAFLAALEEDNTLNKILARKLTQEAVFIAFAVVTALGLVVYGFFRTSGARYRVESAAPLFSSALARLAPAGGLVELRSQGMFKERNFYDAARIAAQQFFAALPGVAPRTKSALRVQAKGGWWLRRALRRDVEQLWQLATNQAPRRYSAGQLAHLLAGIDTLQTALAAGDLRVEATDRAATVRERA